MNILKIVLDLINGKKMNTGMIMIVAVFVLKQLGVADSEANEMATNIMLGVGSVLTAWGYAHRWIKYFQKAK
jgi:hypothetical protein